MFYQTIYQSVGYYHEPDAQTVNCLVRKVVASHMSREACEAFNKTNNDAIQADELELEEIPCVSDYGDPLTRVDFARIYPNRI
jgi:hypothetical protein